MNAPPKPAPQTWRIDNEDETEVKTPESRKTANETQINEAKPPQCVCGACDRCICVKR